MERFPKDFLWGVATSSYQAEGGNSNSDWWEWEKLGKADNESGKACDYWERWKSDHTLLSELGVDLFRTSIEWARVEPEDGNFSEEAIKQYREMFQDLKDRGIKTQVTFWWWTSPVWFQKRYGWHRRRSVKVFVRYVEKISQELGDLIDIFTTFNEPMVPLGQGFLAGVFPPGFRNPWKFWRAINNLARAHRLSYEKIHEIKPGSTVGITYLYNWYESEGLGFILKPISHLSQWFRIDLLRGKIKGFEDYAGVNYYRLGKIRFDWKNIKMDSYNQNYLGFTIEVDKKNIMNWVTYPEGMYKVLKQAEKKFGLPIYVTENGIPTGPGINDEERVRFIEEHLGYIKKAIDEGVDVRGYNYWSLFDNLEWLYGYKPRFGIVEIDYKTLERRPRKSFWEYKEIIRRNSLGQEE